MTEFPEYYECPYCMKRFVRKANFDKHECKQMKRAKAIRTPNGMTAFEYYCLWQKKKGHGVHTQEQFIESKYFTSFFNFVKFSRKIALPGIDKFIDNMIELDIHPKDWSQRIVYDHYMSMFDEIHSPLDQAQISSDTVSELARIFECETDQIFLHMEPSSLIRIVQAKKLSPWFLLFSSKFRWFMQNEMTREQRALLQQYVNPDKWRVKFEQQPEVTKQIQAKVRAMGL